MCCFAAEPDHPQPNPLGGEFQTTEKLDPHHAPPPAYQAGEKSYFLSVYWKNGPVPKNIGGQTRLFKVDTLSSDVILATLGEKYAGYDADMMMHSIAWERAGCHEHFHLTSREDFDTVLAFYREETPESPLMFVISSQEK